MDEQHLHHVPEEELFFKQVKVPYSRSKEQVWEELLPSLGEQGTERGDRKRKRRPRAKWAVAASIALVMGLGLFFRFYTVSVECAPGTRISHQLPDGSNVDLNSDSRLSFHPYWWAIDRSVLFTGEGFFSVEKGSAFTVESEIATTEVLGTSFNISTRYDRYAVFCRTGKVKVLQNGTEESRILEPGMLVEIEGAFQPLRSVDAKKVLAWRDNQMHFDAAPLGEVLEEVGRQYNVNIELKVNNPASIKYSATFDRPAAAATVLNLICETHGLTLTQLDETKYTIVD